MASTGLLMRASLQASWSDGGAQAHDVVVGATAVTYNADFVATQEALPAPWSSSDVGAVAQAGSIARALP